MTLDELLELLYATNYEDGAQRNYEVKITSGSTRHEIIDITGDDDTEEILLHIAETQEEHSEHDLIDSDWETFERGC